jgi:signal transduction histidine kinase
MKEKSKQSEDWGISFVFMRNKQRTTLLRYWTTRYVTTLFIGLLVLSFVSVWWIKQTTLENRLHLLKYLADEAADRVVHDRGQIIIDPILPRVLEERQKLLQLNAETVIYITDLRGEILFTKPRLPLRHGYVLQQEILQNKKSIQRLEVSRGQYVYVVKSPIESSGEKIGWVVIIQLEKELKKIEQEYRLLSVMIIGLGILGWGVIYLLSRKISKPIQHVANAAIQIREGNYDVELNEDVKEHEIYELIQSFKEMTNRLKQLEKLRAELLAGVTHDLKTPVTAISSLVQAVKDEVVSKEEAKEFLDITLKEVQRLQTMIADLLDFNSLSAGAFSIRSEEVNLNEVVKEIGKQWLMTQDDRTFELSIVVPNEPLYIQTDPLRLQQMMVNLLNNAKQALTENGKIQITLYKNEEARVCIDIQDNGVGIPPHEQELIFERFYRGEKKKLKVRGLGLGLPFSKLIAKALKGDLILKETSDKGTTFTIVL